MAGDTVITVVGNLTGDPELRFTPSGAAVANFTIASTPRTFDRNTNEWKEGSTLFLRCSIWREAAENVAESLVKGTRVVAQGRLVQRDYDTREGEKRSVIELQVDEIGPSLRFASAKVTRSGRSGGGGGYGAPQAHPGPQAGYGAPAAPSSAPAYGAPAPAPGGYAPPQPAAAPEDPWATPGLAGSDAEPPF
jgi:single-strand DNA-binding protein